MKCISKSITLLVSAWTVASAAESCGFVDDARIHASDLASLAPAFQTLPPDKDIGPAPAGTMIRIFYKAQLAALLPGVTAELPDRICLQRKRDAIPPEVWQSTVESALTHICPDTPWKAKVLESPQHRFPRGELSFLRSGVVASRSSAQLWRGSLLLPDKSSIPVWVRVEMQTQRHANILQHPVAAGAILNADDYRSEEIWAPGLCVDTKTLPHAEGMVAKRAMKEGTELLKEDLRSPPAVHRGQSVELEAASGGARVRIPAVAEQDGEVGETVHLRSTWNGSKLTGRVTGTRKARVE